MIAADAVTACEDDNTHAFDKLVKLVVALEGAYPKEMEKLRNEEEMELQA